MHLLSQDIHASKIFPYLPNSIPAHNIQFVRHTSKNKKPHYRNTIKLANLVGSKSATGWLPDSPRGHLPCYYNNFISKISGAWPKKRHFRRTLDLMTTSKKKAIMTWWCLYYPFLFYLWSGNHVLTGCEQNVVRTLFPSGPIGNFPPSIISNLRSHWTIIIPKTWWRFSRVLMDGPQTLGLLFDDCVRTLWVGLYPLFIITGLEGSPNVRIVLLQFWCLYQRAGFGLTYVLSVV